MSQQPISSQRSRASTHWGTAVGKGKLAFAALTAVSTTALGGCSSGESDLACQAKNGQVDLSDRHGRTVTVSTHGRDGDSTVVVRSPGVRPETAAITQSDWGPVKVGTISSTKQLYSLGTDADDTTIQPGVSVSKEIDLIDSYKGVGESRYTFSMDDSAGLVQVRAEIWRGGRNQARVDSAEALGFSCGL